MKVLVFLYVAFLFYSCDSRIPAEAADYRDINEDYDDEVDSYLYWKKDIQEE